MEEMLLIFLKNINIFLKKGGYALLALKARSELPWIGTINLLFNDLVTGGFWSESEEITVYNVPSDCIICLVVLIAALISIPISLDAYDYYKKKSR